MVTRIQRKHQKYSQPTSIPIYRVKAPVIGRLAPSVNSHNPTLSMSQDTEELDSSEETLETNETVETNETEETQEETAKKNKSNWAKVSAEAKEAKRLKAELAEAKAQLEEWESTNPEVAESKKDSKRMERIEQELFLARNPDAEKHLDEIRNLTEKYKGMDQKDAWDLLKARIPKESESKTDFSAKSITVSPKKKLEDITEEEALKLPKDQYSKWAEKKYGF